MDLFPSLISAEEIRAYFSTHPIEALTYDQIVDELEHWQRLLEGRRSQEIERKDNPLVKFERRTLRWGGIVVAVAGIPVCFLALPVGLAVAAAGFGLTAYGETKQWIDGRRERKSEQPVELAEVRRSDLIKELKGRKAKPTIPPP